MPACPTLIAPATLLVPAARAERPGGRSPTMAESTAQALNSFLADVERRAFRMAQMALRHDEDALDAVQDAMLRLVRRYSQRPAAEWRPLFYRILENCVRDVQRRRSVRGRVFTWYQRAFGEDGTEVEADPLERV